MARRRRAQASRAQEVLEPTNLEELGSALAEIIEGAEEAMDELDASVAMLVTNVLKLEEAIAEDPDLYRARRAEPAVREMTSLVMFLYMLRDQLEYFRATLTAVQKFVEEGKEVTCVLEGIGPTAEPCPREALEQYVDRLAEAATAPPQPEPTERTRKAAARVAISVARALSAQEMATKTLFEAERRIASITLTYIPYDQEEKAKEMVDRAREAVDGMLRDAMLLEGMVKSMARPALEVGTIYMISPDKLQSLLLI